MSARNTGKARHHVNRKRRIAQRQRNRELFKTTAKAPSAAAAKPKA